MLRTVLPWILVALVAGAWIGSTVFVEEQERAQPLVPKAADGGADVTTELAELRQAVADLRAEVQALRAARERPAPTLEVRTPTSSGEERPGGGGARAKKAAARSAAFEKREEAARQRVARQRRRTEAGKRQRAWSDALRSIKDVRDRERALAEIRAAFDGEDDTARLAALFTVRWMGMVEYDRDDWRAGILPHARSEDPDIRRAAREALLRVKVEPSDLEFWLEEAQTADRRNGEETTEGLVKASGGVIRGEVADAVLHLLRDGTEIRRAGVVRGLQQATEYDAAVEARMIALVRSMPAHDSFTGYYFHFITKRLDPKSDDVLDLMLEHMAKGRDLQTIGWGFRVGLSDAQKDRAADELLKLAEDATTTVTVRMLLEPIEHVARRQHVPRIEALGKQEGADQYVRAAVKRTADAARRRP